MIFGIVTLIICAILLLKHLSRRLGWKMIDNLIGKVHKPLGLMALAVAVIHAAITYDVWDGRSVLVYGSGIISALMIFIMAAGFIFRNRLGHKWIRTHRAGALITLFMVLFHIGYYYVDFFAYKANISGISLSGINVTSIKDGKYEGEYNAGYIYAKVIVKIQDGRIEDISIAEHRNERGARAEEITKDIVMSQKTNVDAVSGATNSSRVIEKAVENALSGK